MSFRILTLSLIIAGSACAESTNRIINTTADLRALAEDEFQLALPVEISGKVLAVRYYGGVIVQDATGGFFFEDIPEPRPEIGDYVSVTGKTYLYEGIRQGAVRGCRASVIRHEAPTKPRLASAATIASGSANFSLVKVRGLVTEAVADENNPNWSYLVLQADGSPLYTTIPNAGSAVDLKDLIDAEVEVCGIGVPHYGAERMFIGPHLEAWSRDCIRVLRHASADPFAAPRLGDIIHISPNELTKMRRHRIEGEVLAVWRKDKALVAEDSGRLLEIELTRGQPLPVVGTRVQAVGFPRTDLFRITLSRALHRPSGTMPKKPFPQATSVAVADITQDGHGHYQLNQKFHGKTIRLTGIVRNLPSPGNGDGRMNLDCDGYLVPVDMSANPSAADGLSIGCEIEATGVCVMEAEKWSSTNLFPVFGGFTLVLRSPDDIRVLSRPSWWTPARLLIVIASLFAALVAFFVWNRILNRLVERRGRQLFKEQVAHAGTSLKIGERTRLAVELHDSLSQNLAGLACQIAAAKSAVAISPAETAKYLNTAEQMLLSSRTELRRCLWDLRGDTLEIASMTEAVTKTVKPVVGNAELVVRFNVPRARLIDSTAHSILCIVRELAANAVRHGHATQIRIAGEEHDNQLSFSVRDNGCGFDVNHHPGLAEGHFGLTGIRERVERLDGTLDLSSDATGTKARITLAVPHVTETEPDKT